MASHWQPDRPYDALPPLPPAVDLETKVVLKQCVAARAALAELKQAAELIPNPTMLINTLPLLGMPLESDKPFVQRFDPSNEPIVRVFLRLGDVGIWVGRS